MANCRKVLVIHGPNLNMLGQREKKVYGTSALTDINNAMQERAGQRSLSLDFLQTNHEGIMVDVIQQAQGQYNCIILNPAAFTHYSIAVRDAVAAITIPVLEVHLSNIYSREEFRHHSVIAPVAKGQIAGFGVNSYLLAVEAAALLLDGEVVHDSATC